MNPNKAMWEKGDFTRIAATMRESGEALVAGLGITPRLKVLDLGCGDGTTALPAAKRTPAAFVADFRNYYGPTRNAFAAAEQGGKAAELQKELEVLFEQQNRSEVAGVTSIPATFLRVTAAV